MACGLFLGNDRPYRHRRDTRECARQLHDSFKAANGATCCRVLSRKVKHDQNAYFQQCADLTAEAAEMAANRHDLMIVGTGPGGLTSAIYGQRLGMNTVVFGDIPGGNLYMIENLMNFPGFVGGVPGAIRGYDLFTGPVRRSFFTYGSPGKPES